jgi:hypothetical protein
VCGAWGTVKEESSFQKIPVFGVYYAETLFS